MICVLLKQKEILEDPNTGFNQILHLHMVTKGIIVLRNLRGIHLPVLFDMSEYYIYTTDWGSF